MVPVFQGNFFLRVCSVSLPARAGYFVGIAIVTILHHKVDPNTFVAVVIVVRLPEGAVGVGGNFIIVAKVMAQHLYVFAIGVAAERHTLPEVCMVNGQACHLVYHRFTVLI